MTSIYITKTPAMILQAYLLAEGLVASVVSGSDWAGYVSSMPDSPDNMVGFYDTSPIKDARLQAGPVVQHYGVMVRVRSLTMLSGWLKIQSIATKLDDLHRAEVTCDSADFRIQTVTRASGPTPLGAEKGSTKRRYIFTLNVLVPIEAV